MRLDYQTLTTGWYSRNRVRTATRLQVGVILIGKGLLGSSIHLSTSTGKLVVVDLDLRGSEGGLSNELLYEIISNLRVDRRKKDANGGLED